MLACRGGGRLFTIRKRFEFSAGHHLTKVSEGHKCAQPHGHNYVVEVELQSEHLSAAGFVIDYGDLETLRRHLDSQYDHQVLNDVMRMEPTAELLAEEIFFWCSSVWHQTSAVRVSETTNTWAEYRP